MPNEPKISFKSGGKVYDIPADKRDAFLLKYPDAIEVSSFISGKDTFDIPIEKIEKFKLKYPDAKPLSGTPKASPEKKNPVGTSSQNGLQGLPDTQALPSSEPTRATPLVGLGGQPVFDNGYKINSANYETKLSQGEEVEFQKWLSKQNKLGNITDGDYKHYQDKGYGYNYDFRAAFKESEKSAINETDNQPHWGDIGKKPNHPTFSDESKYSGVDGMIGGTWKGEEFTPPINKKTSNVPLSIEQPLQAAQENPFKLPAIEAILDFDPKSGTVKHDPRKLDAELQQQAVQQAGLSVGEYKESIFNVAKMKDLGEIEAGIYIVDGNPVSGQRLKDNLYNAKWLEEYREGKHTLQIDPTGQAKDFVDPEIASLAERNLSAGTPLSDKGEMFMSGLYRGAAGVLGLNHLLSSTFEEVTGMPFVQNNLDRAVSKASSEALILKAREQEEKTMQYREGFVDSILSGNYGDSFQQGLNATAASIPHSAIAAATTYAAGPVAAFAVLSPMGASSEFADISITEDEAYKELSRAEKLARSYIVGGVLEPGTDLVAGRALTRSFDLSKSFWKGLVAEAGEKGGEEAARAAAEQASKGILKQHYKNIGLQATEEYFAEGGSQVLQKLTDDLMGIRGDYSLADYLRAGNEAGMLGAFSGGTMTSATGTPTVIAAKGLSASRTIKKYFDERLSEDPEGVVRDAETMVERGALKGVDANVFKANVEARAKAVKAVPKDMVEDTETIDLVEEKQAKKEQAKGLDPIFAAPIEEEIAEIDAKLSAKVRKEYPAPKVNTTPTEAKYASVNRNDGKGTVELTQEEYLAEMERRGTPVEEKTETKSSKKPKAEPVSAPPKEGSAPVKSVSAPPLIESLKGTPVKGPSETMAEGVFQTEVDGVDVLMSEVDENTVKLESIRTPKAQQRQGKAKKVLQQITAKADELGKAIVLDVVPEGESTTEAGLRKLYEEAGFVADGKTFMRREPVKEESKIEEAPIVVSEDKVKQEAKPSKEELLAEFRKLAEEHDRLMDDFEIEEAQKVQSKMDEIAAQIPEEEAAAEVEYTTEELDAREEEMRKEMAAQKGTAFAELQTAFTPISVADYERAMGSGMYKENKKFLTGLVTTDKDAKPIDTRDRQGDEVEYFDPEEIIDFINTVASERAVKGSTDYKIPKQKRAKAASKKEPAVAGKKVSTGDFLRMIGKEIEKGKIGKGTTMSSIPGFTQAWDAAVAAAAKAFEGGAYVSDWVDFIVDHIRKSPQFRNLRPAQRKALDLKAEVLKEMSMDKDAFTEIQIKDIKAKAKLKQEAAVKDVKKEEREKATESTKGKVAKASEKATEKAKQKYVNIGFRIGEAFGKLGGEIRGKAEGRKEGKAEAIKTQREFTKSVDAIISEAIADAKKKSPGFTVSANQLAAASKKLLSVNFNSPISVEKAIEYVDKVLNNATYANDVARTKRLKDVNRKRLNRNDYGIDDGSMSQALKVEHEQLSVEELADYMAFLEGISKGPYNKAENIAMVEKYANLYREQKEAVQEPVSEEQEEGNKKRELSRNEAKQEAIDEFEFERESMSDPVAEAYQKDYTFLKSLTEAELDTLSEKKLRELSNAIRNMREDIGFMSGNAANTIRTLRADRIAENGKQITEDKGFKQLLRDMLLPLKISFSGVQKMTPTDKMKRLISMMPLNRIDSAMKGKTGQDIHDTFVQPISTAFSVFSEKMTQIDKGYDRLYSKVGKSLIPWKREQQRQDEMVKLSLIAIQKEYESNPNNEEVSPLSDYIEAIREAATINDDYAKFAEKYLAIYESMLDGDGNFDYVKQEESLDADTKAFYDYAQSVNASNTPFVEVSAIRNGENVSLRQAYTPISVALIDYSNLSEVQDMANRFSSDDNVKPTAQSGNIKKRTRGGKPLYLDFHRNAKKATRSVLLDYYMREPLRVASRAFNKMAKDPEMSAQSRAFFKGLESNIAQVVKNTFVNEYFEGGLGTLIAETLKKRGYQMALASIPRAGVEFASNMTHAVINKPRELVEGARILSEYKGNDEDLRTLAIFAESAQISRMFERSMSIMSEQGSNTKGSSSAYGRAIDKAADAIMSTPDRALARPIWLGSFSRTFEQVSGTPLDIQQMINSPEYRQENAAAISAARNVADINLSQGFASMNPFEGVVASQVTKSDGIIDTFDKYMTRFMRYEFQSASDALNGLVGRNELSRREASALLAATMVRMAAYQFAMSYAMDMFYSAIESVTGTGPEDDDEDNEELDQKVSSAVMGSVISMLVFRRLGNWAKAPIAFGIETLNNKFGEEAGLRNGEYDPYNNSLVFSPIAGDVQGTDLTASKMVPKFMGPYGPMTKTAFRASELLSKTGVQDGMGGYIIQPSAKSQETIDKANNELAVRIIPELFMQSIGAPVPRDIRNLIIRDVFKDFKESGKSETSVNELRKEKTDSVQEIKDSEVERLKTELKGEYIDPSNGKKIKVSDVYEKLSGIVEKKKVPSKKELRMELAEKYNAKVFSEKEPELAAIFVTDEGEGNSFGDDYLIMASKYKDAFLEKGDPLKIKDGDEKKIMTAMQYLHIVKQRKYIQKVNEQFQNIPEKP